MQDISSTIFHFDAAAAALIVVLFTLGLVNLTLGYKPPLQEQAQRVDLVHVRRDHDQLENEARGAEDFA